MFGEAVVTASGYEMCEGVKRLPGKWIAMKEERVMCLCLHMDRLVR